MAKGATTEVATDRPYESFLTFVNSKISEGTDYNVTDELATEQVEKIAVSTDLDDLFGAMRLQGLIGLKDVDNGSEFEIRGYRIVRSTRDDMSGRVGVYAIMDAIDLFDGRAVALDSSIERVLAFLIKCEQLDKFPVQVKIVKKTTGSGNEVITLGPVVKRP